MVDSADVEAGSRFRAAVDRPKRRRIRILYRAHRHYPGRGRFDEGRCFRKAVGHAKDHGATCYFASVGIANSEVIPTKDGHAR